ncbi:MAG: AIM24 family protein, partial [Thermoguttaceae bacterium]|nr:AIM24 family protein [Thermoguttaceae bacterium]
KRAFLAGSKGIKIEIFFQKKIGAGFFGGEGFIMQKVTGPGIVFLEIDGSAFDYTLGAGETVRCDTGALAWMDPTCSIEIKLVQGGLKGVFFGGEGLFDTIVTGPGRATFQTTNFNNLLQSVASPRK